MNSEKVSKRFNGIERKKNKTGVFSYTYNDHRAMGSTVDDPRMLEEPDKMKYEFMAPEQISTELENLLGFIDVYMKRGYMDDAAKRDATAFLINIKFLDSVGALPGTMQEWTNKLDDILSKKSAA